MHTDLIGRTVSRYRVVELLGIGGMGVVYRGEDLRLRRPVALKFISNTLSEDPIAREQFEREARNASALTHHNICTIYEIDDWENAQRTEIITKGAKKIRSYSLDGKVLWEISGMTTLDVPTPYAKDGLLYVQSGYPTDQRRPAFAIRPGASGDISLKGDETSNDYIVWSQPTLGTYATSSLTYGGYYYTLLDRGFLICNDAKTGKEVYGRQRITTDATGFTASPWAYNGKIFALSEDGDTYVIQAGPEFKVLGKNSLNEMALATPAVANGNLILRTVSTLYRIAKM